MPKRRQRASGVEQLSLDLAVQPPNRAEAVEHITWSYSKRSQFEQCQRRYYYEYFGSTAALANIEPLRADLHHVKTIAGRHERAGSLLHLGIATYFRRAQAGTPMSGDSLADWLLRLFRQDGEYSHSDPDGIHSPGGAYPPVLLLEYYTRQSNADQLLDESMQQLAAALDAFVSAEVFAPFRGAGMRAGALVEKHLSLPGLTCKVGGVLDLAFLKDDQATIVDWKSGSSDSSGTESLQLAVYALWAQSYFQLSPDALHVHKAFLRDATLETYSVTPHLLQQARIRIIQDAERMALVQPYGEAGRSDAFTPCGQVRVCRLCPYQRICPEGGQLLHA